MVADNMSYWPIKSKANYMLPYGCRRVDRTGVRSPEGWWFFFGKVRHDTYFNQSMARLRYYYRIERARECP